MSSSQSIWEEEPTSRCESVTATVRPSPDQSQSQSFAATIARMSPGARQAANARATRITQSGSSIRLTPDQINRSEQAFLRSVADSSPRFSDPRSVSTIQDTLVETLHDSQTFRNILCWSRHTETGPALQSFEFYDSSDSTSLCDDAQSLHAPRRDDAWIAQEDAYDPSQDEQYRWRTIWVAPPPSQGTQDQLNAWKTELIFQVVRVMIGEGQYDQPVQDRDAAALLAQHVAYDMHWTADVPLLSQSPSDIRYAKSMRPLADEPDVPDVPLKLTDVERVKDQTRSVPAGTYPPVIAEVMEKILENGQWQDERSDLVPALIPRVYPDVKLTIQSQGNNWFSRDQVFVAGDDYKLSPQRAIKLLLKDDHYTYTHPKTGSVYNPPKDGNCFYSCVLFALNEKKPTREEITELRAAAAQSLAKYSDDLIHYIPTPAE